VAAQALRIVAPLRSSLRFAPTRQGAIASFQHNIPGVAPPAGMLLPFGEPTLRPQRGQTCQPSQNGWVGYLLKALLPEGEPQSARHTPCPHMRGNGSLGVVGRILRPSAGPTADMPTSVLSPPTSDLRPPPSDLRPPTSDLSPLTSDLRPRTSDLQPPTSVFRPRTSVPRPPTRRPYRTTNSDPEGGMMARWRTAFEAKW
jgi:hypothetical protein